MHVVTRFAPSPTGFLHIGGARTALFNYLFAKHWQGKFLLRIEDTDKERSTQEAIDAIIEGLKWLELPWNGEFILQSTRATRHVEVAKQLLAAGQAYYCYASQEELAIMREQAMLENRPFKYDGRWRDRDSKDAPAGIKPVIRIKAPQTGETIINDAVQGKVTVANSQLDDMVLLRSDGSPTYMFAVVVDDHDMGITHIVRGDDHLTNAFRQKVLYEALDWDIPIFAHIPLIHGPDGAKLSKRHGALGIEAYRDMGYLPEALRNYLLRLGWSHGNDEIISTEQAIAWFNLESIGKSPARIDFKKMENLNAHYIKNYDNHTLVQLIQPRIEKILGSMLDQKQLDYLNKGMTGLKTRAKTLTELGDNAMFYVLCPPFTLTDKAQAMVNEDTLALLHSMTEELINCKTWEEESLHQLITDYTAKHNIKLGDAAQILRIALTGSTISPSVFEIMAVLGKDESLARLNSLDKSVR